MRSPLLLTSVLASLATAGCIGSSASDTPDAEAAASTSAQAVVVIERTTGPGDAVRGDAVIARFVRVHQGTIDDQALRIAGAAWDPPALGRCTTAQESPLGALQPRSVELVNVGVLTLEASTAPTDPRTGKTTELLPRTLPDTGLVSGVVYSARSNEAFAPSERLQLHAGSGADGFFATVTAPRDVTDVHVTSSAAGLDVSWDAAATDDARDLVYIDVTGASSRLVARCAMLDVGQFVVPGAVLGAGLDEGQVAVHRLHRETFQSGAAGSGMRVDSGEVRFDVARVVAFHR